MLRRVFIAIVALVVLLGVTFPAYAHHHKHRHHHKHHHLSSSHHSGHSGGHHGDSSDDSSSDSSGGDNSSSDSSDSSASQTTDGTTTGGDTSTDMTADNTASGAVPAATGAEKLATFKITGFGKIDNTPRNSTTISFHCIHQEAGGTGTWTDPLTAATPGHAGSTENPKCTKFYVPGIHRYVVIEDSGATKFSQPHLDIWSGTTDNVEDCESKITKTEQIIVNPGPNHPVKAGPIATGSGCNI